MGLWENPTASIGLAKPMGAFGKMKHLTSESRSLKACLSRMRPHKPNAHNPWIREMLNRWVPPGQPTCSSRRYYYRKVPNGYASELSQLKVAFQIMSHVHELVAYELACLKRNLGDQSAVAVCRQDTLC